MAKADTVDPKDALIAELQSQVAELRTKPAYAPYIANPTAADLDTYKDGKWNRIADGVSFALKIVPEEESNFGRTHLLKNNTHFVEISKDEFRAQFEKP